MTFSRRLACLALAGVAAACSSSTPTAPGGGSGPTPSLLSVTYTGQIRVDSCSGCVNTSGLLATRPFVLRLNEVAPGQVEGTFDFGYHSSFSGPLTVVSGSKMPDGSFKLSGRRSPLSATDSTDPVDLTSLVFSELPGGTLTGSAEFTVSGSVLANGVYRSTLVSGTRSGIGSASVGIDGRWQGHTEIVSCSGDLCSGHVVPGRVRSIAFSFATQSTQLQGVAGSDNYFYLPAINAALPLQGTFAGQALTAGVDTEVIEVSQSDHVAPNTEFARLRVRVSKFAASIDAYNRMQGDVSYSVVRTITYKNSALQGQVQHGTFTVRLRDVVPKPLS